MLAVKNFHVDVSVHHVVLVDEILDVDQKSRHIAIVLFEMLEECVEVHFADFVIRGAGTMLFFGALWALVVGRAGSSRLVVFVEVDVDVGDEVKRGSRFGYIRFGSRVDIYLPSESRPLVSVGDRILAHTTALALWP